MRNVRLYLGGKRADLDGSTSFPFTLQTSDSEMPTAVKNSFSKTISLPGTDTNRRLFGGLWHLDSVVPPLREQRPPEFVVDASELSPAFTYRSTPSVAVGDSLVVKEVRGNSLVWGQMVGANTTSVTIPSGHKYFSVINSVKSVGTSTGAAIAVTGGTDMLFDLTSMFGSGNEPATAAEFEALYPLSYYTYDPGRMLNLTASGLRTSGRNIWDEEWELGRINQTTGANTNSTTYFRSQGYIPILQSTTYYFKKPTGKLVYVFYYDGSKNYLGYRDPFATSGSGGTFTTITGACYMRFHCAGTTYNHDICINLSDPSFNGQYEPYWSKDIALSLTSLTPADKPTLRLNQLAPAYDYNRWIARTSNVTKSLDTTTEQIILTVANSTSSIKAIYLNGFTSVVSHKYYLSVERTCTDSTTGCLGFRDNSSNAAIINTGFVEGRSSVIGTLTANAYLAVYVGNSIASGVVAKFKNIICIDLTEMYGAGNEPTSTAEVEEQIGSEYIPYNTGTDIPNRIFPAGLKKAGSVYDSTDGVRAVKRIGVVDLGTLTWSYNSSSGFFYTGNIMGHRTNNIRCVPYTTTTANGANMANRTISDFPYNASGNILIKDSAYTDAATFKAAMSGVLLYYELATPQEYTLSTPLNLMARSDTGGSQQLLPENTATPTTAAMIAAIDYGHIKTFPEPEQPYNPMKKVEFELFVDEMVVERGYAQLTGINRTGRNHTFSLSLYGGLGEFFYNLQTGSDGEKKTLADLTWPADLGFRVNAAYVQQVWDDILNGSLPTIAFVPMHNGVPDTLDADKALISGGGVPVSITEGADTYGQKNGCLLAKFGRKMTEWEVGDLRSYLQRPALRLKDFIDAVCDPQNNGGWSVDRDSVFFDSSNPYYWNTYILLPQLNVEEETEDVCDDGSFAAVTLYGSPMNRRDLTPQSSCMVIASEYVDMSGQAANAYLSVSVPVKSKMLGVQNYGDLYMSYRVSGTTLLESFAWQAVAYDEDGGVLGTSPRYLFCTKNHHGEVPASVLYKPSVVVPASDALIEGVWKNIGGEYVFVQDDTGADTFVLQIDNIPRPTTAGKKVRIEVLLLRSFSYYDLNTHRKGSARGRIDDHGTLNLDTQFRGEVLAGAGNSLRLVEPTQYATDSVVSQEALLSSLETTPLDLLLSITKSFGLMWLQDNRSKRVGVYLRRNFYTGEVEDIHERVDYGKGQTIRPVTAESNLYTLENEYPETTLSKAYESDYGRRYGGVRLNTGYEFTLEKIETMEKVELKGYVDGALNGSGYWTWRNTDGLLPSAIAEGLTVTYYKESGGQTSTKDAEYNLFNVTSVEKTSSPVLGVACRNEEKAEKSVEVAPALVFYTGGRVTTAAHLSDDTSDMRILNEGPCWVWNPALPAARVPEFRRVAVYGGEQYSLDFGTPKLTYYAPPQALAPEQALYARFWEGYLTDLLNRNTKKVECYVVFPPHQDMRQKMRQFFLFDRSLWVLNKVSDYDPTKEQAVKCEFIRVMNKDAYIE